MRFCLRLTLFELQHVLMTLLNSQTLVTAALSATTKHAHDLLA